MKKILVVVLLSIITSMTIYFVAFWKSDNNMDNNMALEYKSKYKNSYNDIENSNNENYKGKVKNKNDNIMKNNERENKSYNMKLEENSSRNQRDIEAEDKVANSNVQIFNIKKEEIVSSLNIKEKSKIISIINKLSSVDIERIREMLSKKGEKEGAKEIVRILKLRLVEKDYNDIKSILSPYINIEFLEELI